MDTIERSIWIDAPRERVWLAITQADQIAGWLLPALPSAEVKRHADDKLTLVMGGMEMDFAVLENIDSPRRVTSRGLPDRSLATTYALEAENGGTRVTVTMSGFEALPGNALQDRLDVTGVNWDKTLANLQAAIGGQELPHPYASVAPLFGFWRESKEMIAVERSVWIAAPRERVWLALTDANQVEQWFAPGTTFKFSGEGVGSRLYVENPETGAEMYVQILELVEPPSRLALRSLPEPPEETSFVTSYRLDTEKDGTRLTLTYSGYEKVAEAARRQPMEENTFGFGMMLGNIKAVVEGIPLPQPGGF